MKKGLIAVAIVASFIGGELFAHPFAKWHTDNRMAAGEWKIQMQTPPCDDVHNLQVIWPAHSGEPMTIECDSMPVPEK